MAATNARAHIGAHIMHTSHTSRLSSDAIGAISAQISGDPNGLPQMPADQPEGHRIRHAHTTGHYYIFWFPVFLLSAGIKKTQLTKE